MMRKVGQQLESLDNDEAGGGLRKRVKQSSHVDLLDDLADDDDEAPTSLRKEDAASNTMAASDLGAWISSDEIDFGDPDEGAIISQAQALQQSSLGEGSGTTKADEADNASDSNDDANDDGDAVGKGRGADACSEDEDEDD